MASNFDTVSLHTWPNVRSPNEIWPDLNADEKEKLDAYEERMARENPGYIQLGGDVCGKRDLAGKSVAVPFVGTTAAALVIAEVIRMLHDGPKYLDLRLGLGDPEKRWFSRDGNYSASDATGIKFVGADKRRLTNR